MKWSLLIKITTLGLTDVVSWVQHSLLNDIGYSSLVISIYK